MKGYSRIMGPVAMTVIAICILLRGIDSIAIPDFSATIRIAAALPSIL